VLFLLLETRKREHFVMDSTLVRKVFRKLWALALALVLAFNLACLDGGIQNRHSTLRSPTSFLYYNS
jgi:hypothetical protein